jgi:hypothetical protein
MFAATLASWRRSKLFNSRAFPVAVLGLVLRSQHVLRSRCCEETFLAQSRYAQGHLREYVSQCQTGQSPICSVYALNGVVASLWS